MKCNFIHPYWTWGVVTAQCSLRFLTHECLRSLVKNLNRIVQKERRWTTEVSLYTSQSTKTVPHQWITVYASVYLCALLYVIKVSSSVNVHHVRVMSRAEPLITVSRSQCHFSRFALRPHPFGRRPDANKSLYRQELVFQMSVWLSVHCTATGLLLSQGQKSLSLTAD